MPSSIGAIDYDATAPPEFELSGPLMRLRSKAPCGPAKAHVRSAYDLNQTNIFHQGDTSMNSIKMALATLVCGMLTLPAHADAVSGGKVTSVNADGKSFTFARKKKHWTFKITDKTVVRVGEKTGNLSDLKPGQPVKVEFQRQGPLFTALLIGIGF
jgi:hypothetical protein